MQLSGLLPLLDGLAEFHRLAEMATRTQAARLLVYAAASRYDAGDAGVTEASAMAKLYATETAQAVGRLLEGKGVHDWPDGRTAPLLEVIEQQMTAGSSQVQIKARAGG